jgi:hypothetical protein
MNIETVPPNAGALGPWWLWLLLGLAAMSGFLIASFVLPRREVAESRVFVWGEIAAYAIALLVILFAIFFSQSEDHGSGHGGHCCVCVAAAAPLIWTAASRTGPHLVAYVVRCGARLALVWWACNAGNVQSV